MVFVSFKLHSKGRLKQFFLLAIYFRYIRNLKLVYSFCTYAYYPYHCHIILRLLSFLLDWNKRVPAKIVQQSYYQWPTSIQCYYKLRYRSLSFLQCVCQVLLTSFELLTSNMHNLIPYYIIYQRDIYEYNRRKIYISKEIEQ